VIDAGSFDFLNGLFRIRMRCVLDADKKRPRAVSGGQLVQFFCLGALRITDAPDDDMVGSCEVSSEDGLSDTCGLAALE